MSSSLKHVILFFESIANELLIIKGERMTLETNKLVSLGIL